jgi:hypothetical protein
LFWGNGKFRRTVPIDRESDNVATLELSPGYTRYDTYCQEAGVEHTKEDEADPLTAFEINALRTAVEREDPITCAPCDQTSGWESGQPGSEAEVSNDKPVKLDLDGPLDSEGAREPSTLNEEDEEPIGNPTSELLRLHYSFGHLPFAKLQEMAKRNVIPKRLANCNVPVCAACQYAKASKRAWRPRTSKNYVDRTPTEAGQVVSVDQLV